MITLNINDYVRYGSNGICKVVGCEKMADLSEKKEFYILRPVSDELTKLFVPVDSEILMSKMGKVFSKNEIDSLILSAKGDELAWISDRNERSSQFQALIKTNNPRELLRLIHCIYTKKQDLLQRGKRLSTTDDTNLKQAETRVENEFAFSLGVSKKEVGPYIRKLLGIPENSEAN